METIMEIIANTLNSLKGPTVHMYYMNIINDLKNHSAEYAIHINTIWNKYADDEQLQLEVLKQIFSNEKNNNTSH